MTRTPTSERIKEVQARSRQQIAALREERNASRRTRLSRVAEPSASPARSRPDRLPPVASPSRAEPAPAKQTTCAAAPADAGVVAARATPDRNGRKPSPSPGPSPAPAAPVDIDAISGLGSALKSKLRRLGLGTAEKLAVQNPDTLRAQLGPVARLVNIESLIRSAVAARGAPDPAPRRQARGQTGRV